MLGVAADQGTDTTVGYATVTAGTSINFGDSPINAARGIAFISPVYILGATTGACTVTIQRFKNR